MRDAAVGFQCPSCIAQGKKETRSGRTPYGGMRPSSQGVVSKTLIALNGAVWLTRWTGFRSIAVLTQPALRFDAVHPARHCCSSGSPHQHPSTL